MSELMNIMTQIIEEPTLDRKHRLFASFMEGEFGYRGVNYGIFLDTRSPQAIYSNFVAKRTGWSSEWRETYRKEGYHRNDLAMIMAAVTPKPILQTRFYRILQQNELPTRYAQVIRGVQDYVKCGVIVPISANGCKGVIGLYDPEGNGDKHDKRYGHCRSIIEALAKHLHLSSNWASEIVSQTGLSDMNLRVLRLKARGMRVKQILHEIDRDNPKTVDNHMARVRKALGARNDVEALAKAATLGLLGSFWDDQGGNAADFLPKFVHGH